MKFARRDFLKTTLVAGTGVAFFSKFAMPDALAINTSPSLQKWMATNPLRGLGPTGIPVLSSTPDPVFPNCLLYQVTAGEFTDTLHPSLGPTKLWGYWDSTSPIPRHLGGVVAITRGTAARMRFTNTLPSRHILPLDVTMPGANQGQNRMAIHLHGGFVPWLSDGGPFEWFSPGCPDYSTGQSFLNGPGGVLDNIPENKMQPGQADYFYPNDQSTRLMWYHDHAWGITRLNAYAGLATAYLVIDPANDALRLTANTPALSSPEFIPLIWQEKSFVWGTPGNPLAVPPVLPTGTFLTDPTWADITRPDVQTPGSLWYDHTYNTKTWKRQAAGALPLPDPSIIAEFFGDTILTNGTVYPLATVDPKRYRFMLLNATNARFFNINTFVADATPDGITLTAKTLFPANLPGPAITQIGSEGGYLAKEVVFTSSALTAFNPKTVAGNLIMGPAERADVVIDFSAFAGQDIIIYNDAPAPFPGGAPINDYFIGNAANPAMAAAVPGFGPDTRQLLRIRVAATVTPPTPPAVAQPPLVATPVGEVYLKATTTGLDPAPIAPIVYAAGVVTTPASVIPPLVAPAGAIVRPLTLNEAFDRYGRLIQLLGTTAPQPAGGFGMALTDPPTEVVTAGATEVWQIFNTTADTHPMHFHLVNAQVLSRQPFSLVKGVPTPKAGKNNVPRGPEPNELGWKETIKMNPGEVTSILMQFVLPATPFTVPPSPRTGGNEYVWHCHILEHEEHDMMRPMVVN